MAATTLYRFHIELSDVQRSVYETLELRVAQHPSEGMSYLLTRVLAFALNCQEGLAFAPTGLCDPDAAAIHQLDPQGTPQLLIEIGSPSARRLHKGMKSAGAVKVYTYKNPDGLLRELRDEKIHRAEEIEFFSLAPGFLDELAALLKRDNRWSLLVNEGSLNVQVGDVSVAGELLSHRL